MLECGGGSIVNIASCAGMVAVPRCAEYVAAKHGVIGLTKSAALDYATSGIRVNAVLPGLVDTARVKESYIANDADIKLSSWMLDHHAMKRRGHPAEIAEASCWLLSDRSSFVTGASVPVDGGYLTS
jgi:NAD(P)-dependent dehydrogenase (short-subunit alcohol dehydrogenase family)